MVNVVNGNAQADQRKSVFHPTVGTLIEGTSFDETAKAFIEKKSLRIVNTDTRESKLVRLTEMSWVSDDFVRFTYRDENRYMAYIFMELHQEPIVMWVTRWSMLV